MRYIRRDIPKPTTPKHSPTTGAGQGQPSTMRYIHRGQTTGPGKVQQTKGSKGEAGVQLGKSKFGKHTVDWVKVRNMKTEEGRKIFSVSREKYFSKLIGYSKEFTAKVRWDVATKLAEAEKKRSSDLSLRKEDLVHKYDEQLKNKSVPELLSYARKEREAFIAANKPIVESAIDAFNAKYLDSLEKNLPLTKSSERKAFIKDFMESATFDEKGGNVRSLNHQEMEDALFTYITEESKQYKLDRADVLAIRDSRWEENEAIKDLKEHFDGKAGVRIDPKRTEQLIDLWQKQTGHQKSVGENKEEVRKFILGAYKQGEEIVPKEGRSINIKPNESLPHYEERLKKVIEKNIKNNPAARIAYGDDKIQEDLDAALASAKKYQRGKYENEAMRILENIKPKKDETTEQYSNRAWTELQKKFDTTSDELKNKAAISAHAQFMANYLSQHEWKF